MYEGRPTARLESMGISFGSSATKKRALPSLSRAAQVHLQAVEKESYAGYLDQQQQQVAGEHPATQRPGSVGVVTRAESVNKKYTPDSSLHAVSPELPLPPVPFISTVGLGTDAVPVGLGRRIPLAG